MLIDILFPGGEWIFRTVEDLLSCDLRRQISDEEL